LADFFKPLPFPRQDVLGLIPIRGDLLPDFFYKFRQDFAPSAPDGWWLGGGIEPPIQFQAFQSDKHIDFIHLCIFDKLPCMSYLWHTFGKIPSLRSGLASIVTTKTSGGKSPPRKLPRQSQSHGMKIWP
jgi:hypothetical protein